jgi:hypothetical protein
MRSLAAVFSDIPERSFVDDERPSKPAGMIEFDKCAPGCITKMFACGRTTGNKTQSQIEPCLPPRIPPALNRAEWPSRLWEL